jgi:hypothetical protein
MHFLRSNRSTIFGLALFGFIGNAVFAFLAPLHYEFFKAAQTNLKKILTGQRFRVPTLLVLAMILTSIVIYFHPSDNLLIALFAQTWILLLWVAMRVVFSVFPFLVVMAVCAVPPAIIADSTSKAWPNSYYFIYTSVFVIWTTWLVLSRRAHRWPQRVLFWLGTLGVAAYVIL